MAETILTDNTTQKEDFIPSPENQNIGKREIIENKLEKSSIVTPDPNAAIEKIESDNITFKEQTITEVDPDNTTVEKTFREIPKEIVAAQATKWLKGYSEKTGIFDSKEGTLKGFNAKNVIDYIIDSENEKGEENSITRFLKKDEYKVYEY